jgi:proteasome lid subunit RPN8/RPN11
MVILSEQMKRRMFEQARYTYPRECCGILLGKMDGDGRRVVARVCRTKNVETQARQTKHFRICADSILYAEYVAAVNDYEIVGFYHSHTDSAAIASEEDSRYAIPGLSYPIISVYGGEVMAMTSWEKKSDETDDSLVEELVQMKE